MDTQAVQSLFLERNYPVNTIHEIIVYDPIHKSTMNNGHVCKNRKDMCKCKRLSTVNYWYLRRTQQLLFPNLGHIVSL